MYIFIINYNIIIVILFWWSPFIPYRNLYEVITYNHMAIMSLRSHSHVKVSIVLTRANNLFIQNYIRLLLNIILRPILIVRMGLELASYRSFDTRLSDALAN